MDDSPAAEPTRDGAAAPVHAPHRPVARGFYVRGTGTQWEFPDLVLACGFGALAFLPATRGLSACLAPTAWLLGAWDARRCRRRGTPQSDRAIWGGALGRALCVVVAALACLVSQGLHRPGTRVLVLTCGLVVQAAFWGSLLLV